MTVSLFLQVFFDWVLWWFGKVIDLVTHFCSSRIVGIFYVHLITFSIHWVSTLIWKNIYFRVWKGAGLCSHILEGHSDAVSSVCIVNPEGIKKQRIFSYMLPNLISFPIATSQIWNFSRCLIFFCWDSITELMPYGWFILSMKCNVILLNYYLFTYSPLSIPV